MSLKRSKNDRKRCVGLERNKVGYKVVSGARSSDEKTVHCKKKESMNLRRKQGFKAIFRAVKAIFIETQVGVVTMILCKMIFTLQLFTRKRINEPFAVKSEKDCWAINVITRFFTSQHMMVETISTMMMIWVTATFIV